MAMTDATEAHLCIMCDNGNAGRCTKCKSARYCSKACQKADSRVHKLLCADFANFDLSTRPSNDHIRAISFPTDERKPKFVWAQTLWREEGPDEDLHQIADCRPFLGSDAVPYYEIITYDKVLERELSNTVQVSIRENCFEDGSKFHSSMVAALCSTSGIHVMYRGGILAWSMIEPGLDAKTCKDIDMIDFRHVVHMLKFRQEEYLKA